MIEIKRKIVIKTTQKVRKYWKIVVIISAVLFVAFFCLFVAIIHSIIIS